MVLCNMQWGHNIRGILLQQGYKLCCTYHSTINDAMAYETLITLFLRFYYIIGELSEFLNTLYVISVCIILSFHKLLKCDYFITSVIPAICLSGWLVAQLVIFCTGMMRKQLSYSEGFCYWLNCGC